MAMRVCATPGCPTLVTAGTYRGLCPSCAQARDRKRGSASQRGYGTAHRALRARTQAAIDAGQTVVCATCGTQLRGRDWHLGHTDDRASYIGPQCPPCNLGAAGRAAHRR